MIRQTQSSLAPYGNCWQTAVACVLEVPAAELPAQNEIERFAEEERARLRAEGRDWPSWLSWLCYRNSLNRYLAQHHRLLYGEVRFIYDAIEVTSFEGHHVICGPSERTATNGGIDHCVVGRHGGVVWDPHPSRAGLTGVKEWGVLAPLPEDWEPSKMHAELPCLCPECGGLEQLREATP